MVRILIPIQIKDINYSIPIIQPPAAADLLAKGDYREFLFSYFVRLHKKLVSPQSVWKLGLSL
jgi:hypothetical protein